MLKKVALMALCFTASINASSVSAEPHYADTFPEAKRQVMKIYGDHLVDQYCGCTFNSKKQVDLASCGYEPRKNLKRAERIEIEHVMPAESIGRQHACWKQGGREFCNQTDKSFANAHNDLHNFLPVVGEVNGDRSNFRYNEVPQGYGQYGACKFKVDFAGRSAEPPPGLKGDLARISLYMRDQHGIKLSRQQEQLFSAWSKMDPVDSWELERDRRIARIQGNSNPYVTGKAAVPGQSAPSDLSKPFPQEKLILTQAEPAKAAPVTKAVGGGCEQLKSCKQMSSCEEAKHQLNVCGNTKIDGNRDGVPCEALCR